MDLPWIDHELHAVKQHIINNRYFVSALTSENPLKYVAWTWKQPNGAPHKQLEVVMSFGQTRKEALESIELDKKESDQ